jgi:hypothetical protein
VMQTGDHDFPTLPDLIEQRVWKLLQVDPASIQNHLPVREGIAFDACDGLFNPAKEFAPKTLPLSLIPVISFLDVCGRDAGECRGQGLGRRIAAFTSDQGLPFSSPSSASR